MSDEKKPGMTVSEMIKLLSEFPGDLLVFTYDSDYGHELASKPELANRWSYRYRGDYKERGWCISERPPGLVEDVLAEPPVVVLQ